MPDRLENVRILMYSHDTFGLGHLRRCTSIAHSLVNHYRGLSVLIMSGATIAGAFDYRSRVDFVKIPSVIKLRNGEYTSLGEHLDLEQTLAMRRSIIRYTAESFKPDIFIVDKEPMGLKGEIEDTLQHLKSNSTKLVLGLRDVMDAPHLLRQEWAQRDIMTKIERYFDQIWVYGPESFYDPLVGLEVSEKVRERMDYVGFLRRRVPENRQPGHIPKSQYILVTTGGGGDGGELVEKILNAYELESDLSKKALIVLGPYMPAKERYEYKNRGEKLSNVDVIEFDNRMEELIDGASAVVAMGGYNTFCEILSFNKPALIIPRIRPRQEQLIRANRAAELGLVQVLHPDEAADAKSLANILNRLVDHKSSIRRQEQGWMRGLSRIHENVFDLVSVGRDQQMANLRG